MNKNIKIILVIFFIVGCSFIFAAYFQKSKDKKYVITFDTNGGAYIPSIEVKDGETIIKPIDPTKDGFNFNYWEYEGKEYDFTSEVKKNMILEAKWEEEKTEMYILTFVVDGEKETLEVSSASEIDLEKLTFEEKDGYVLKWYVDGNEYDMSTTLIGDLTIEGKYVETSVFIIKFNSDGGSKVNNQIVPIGDKVKEPADVTKEGYILIGWYLNDEKYDFNTKITKNITLTAKWKENTKIKRYEVTFDTVGGSIISSQIIIENQTATEPKKPTKVGYAFEGWYLKDKKYDFKTKITNDITLVAKWRELKKYMITFNSNGGSSITSQTVTEGGKTSKPNNPTKDGYIFKEWQLNGETYDFNSIVTGNITLNAIWEEEKLIPISSDGTINNAYFNIIKNSNEQSAFKNTKGINDALKYASDNNIKKVKLESGIYYIETASQIKISSTTRYYAIKLFSDVNFDLNNSTLKLVSNSYPRYNIFLAYGVNNVSVYNGKIIGDRMEHKCSDGSYIRNGEKCNNDTLPTHEWGYGIFIKDSNGILVNNLDLSEMTGDGICISTSNNINITNNNIHYVRRNGISIISGKYINILNNEIHDIIGVAPQVGIDIEKDNVNQVYEYINIKNNRIYNTVSHSIDIVNKIYNLNITGNQFSKTIYTRVKARSKLDDVDSDEFPTDANDEYLMKNYNIIVNNNKVIDYKTIASEHGYYEITATDDTVNKLNYKGYIALKSIQETNNKYEYQLKVKSTYNIPILFRPLAPTYKVVSYSSSDNSIAKVSTNGKITTVSTGTAIITVTAMDYGINSKDKSDDKELSFEIVVNVIK